MQKTSAAENYLVLTRTVGSIGCGRTHKMWVMGLTRLCFCACVFKSTLRSFARFLGYIGISNIYL